MDLDEFSKSGLVATLLLGILNGFAFVALPFTVVHPVLAGALLYTAAFTHLPTREKIGQYRFLVGAVFSASFGIWGYLKGVELVYYGMMFGFALFFVGVQVVVEVSAYRSD